MKWYDNLLIKFTSFWKWLNGTTCMFLILFATFDYITWKNAMFIASFMLVILISLQWVVESFYDDEE